MRRAIVVGGSLGGLFAGCNLMRAGWDVTIVERTAGPLAGRGAGLGVHAPMVQTLLAAGCTVDATLGVPIPGRICLARDGSALARIRMPQFGISWGKLYSLLSAVFPEERIRRGAGVVAVEQDADRVVARLEDGASLEGEVLVGADGLRSTVRRQFLPDVGLVYAGYIAWRGLAEEAALKPASHAQLFHLFAFAIPEGEHILGYPVPGANDDVRPGHRRYNFVWYRPVTPEALRDMQTDDSGRHHPDGIPPHAIRRDVVARMYADAEATLPASWVDVIRSTAMPLFQPIGDLESPRIAFGRVAILGDAAFTARPHVAQGAIKAGFDAMELAAALNEEPTVEAALQRYDAARRPAGQAVVDESRRLGAYLEGRLGRIRRDPEQVIRENGGVNPADANADGGVMVGLLRELGYA
jgi:2-polyprenyl-6-methoxyphenol hydroxylase-like FAD-dependent oxidoreductase